PDADAMEAELKLSQLRWTEAARLASRALDTLPTDEVDNDKITLAAARLHLGNSKEAKTLCTEVLEAARRNQDIEQTAEGNMALAEVLIVENDWKAAAIAAESAFQVFAGADETELQWFALHYLSQVAAGEKDLVNSKKYAQQALDLLSQFEHNWEASLFQSYIERPDVKEARRQLLRAIGGELK
ncbi:MAG: hypothetical protein WA324_05005, partial [Bryobacteraceae bacterium]